MRYILYWRGAATRLGALLLIGLLAGGAFACAPAVATEPAPPTPTLPPGSDGRIDGHGIAPGASMRTARASHTATRLRDGKVLVVGGFKADGVFLTSAELYDPATHTFLETGHTAVAHTSHTATLLPNGKVLVAGGVYGQPQQTAELYDPATGRFGPAPGMSPERRDGFTATLLATGEVLLAGGYSVHGGYAARGDILDSAEIYNLTTNTFRPAGRMITPRAIHTATLLADGRVLFTGGFTPQGVTASAELYDPATNTFAPTGQMTAKRQKHAAVRIEDGRVLIVGGSDEHDYGGAMPAWNSSLRRAARSRQPSQWRPRATRSPTRSPCSRMERC
jgi:Galactose oxidase, central domain